MLLRINLEFEEPVFTKRKFSVNKISAVVCLDKSFNGFQINNCKLPRVWVVISINGVSTSSYEIELRVSSLNFDFESRDRALNSSLEFEFLHEWNPLILCLMRELEPRNLTRTQTSKSKLELKTRTRSSIS